MPSVKVYLNSKYKKKDGSCSIYLLVHIDYKSLKFPTGVSCIPDDKHFNFTTMRIRGNSNTVKDDNLTIEKCLANMNDIFVRYRLQQIRLTPELLKNEWKNPSRRIDFYAFFDEVIAERQKDIRKQTYKNHSSEIKKLKEFRPVLTFTEFTQDFLDNYRRWLKTEKKNDINTIFTSFKVLRTYMNIAIRKGVITENPFNQVRINKTKPEMVFLSVEELDIMWKLYLKNELSKTYQKVLRHFLFMCFTGVRISDFKALTKYNLNGKLLIYYPEKTSGIKKTPVKVPLSKYAVQLINHENSKLENLFRPISEQKMNEYIKIIAGGAKVFKPLTNHSARHTFATAWLEKTHDLAALQQLLGHSKITDTMKYVHVTEKMLKDQMREFEKSIFSHIKKAPVPLNQGYSN